MLEFIRIQRFKSLLDASFSLSSLNLFAGLNGMGKSSLIQSLLLLRQSHARNALGVFIPYYRAIGVTARLGDKHMGFTLSHEWAHFMDHYLGGDKFHFSSDEIGSLSNVIADRFRNNMQKRQTSDYQQRTCECFARAFEEYFSIKTGDSDTLLAGSSKEGNYVEPEFFKKDIAPLIESFFEQNSSMLKAMKVSIRNLK